MALWEQNGTSGFQQRKAANENDNNNGQRSSVKGVLTCTIATILHAKHSEADNCFIYKHLKFNTCMVMGIVRQVNHEVNNSLATYQIDDHSGSTIEVKWWHDDSSEPLKPLTYVKVVGQVKIFAGKIHIVAHHVGKMKSLNELIAHSIECIHASMSIRKQNELTVPSTSISNNSNRNALQTQNPSVSNGFSPIQNAILNLLKTATSPAGYSVTEICKQIKQFNEYQIKQTLEFLSGEGHIYSTTDDDHFRAASD